MNKSALFSIHPTHMNNIMKGFKTFEYRRQRPKHKISHIVFYCTSPISMIVAVAEVIDIISDKPNKVWNKTSFGSGLSHTAFRTYFNTRTIANAFALGNVYRLSVPLALRQLTCLKSPPQSFCYLSENDMALIMDSTQQI